ncbi:DUF2750 domain-containing protein [Marinomonas sp. C2222]|uniref:DUF2750 domain-containing protein n=1 Tax=Marinomonas sargassi TaxID=2984494 RepID=A0ABT2YS10_9GAMM|nr:DUF2750 domain-containing protein [Marinomonas sargassi]MCV2402677.1 DUF2750 domain-containing protein [Marinomonas sargassi]
MTNSTLFDDTFYRSPSSDRYAQVIEYIKSGNSIWTLMDAEGCLIIELGQDKVLPIWPAEALATDWGKKDYEGFSALEITAKTWQETWLTGMTQDKYAVGVAPNLAGECIVCSAEEHAADLKA